MQLGERIYESAMMKGDLLTFFQELTKALKMNTKVVEQTSHSMLLGDEDLQHHDLASMSTGTSIFTKSPFNLVGRDSTRYC